VVAELLRDPSGAARDTVPIEGSGDGAPDVAGAQFVRIAPGEFLGRQQGVEAEIVHGQGHGGLQ